MRAGLLSAVVFAAAATLVTAQGTGSSRELLQSTGIQKVIQSALDQIVSPQVGVGFGGSISNVSREIPPIPEVLGVEASQLNPSPQCEATINSALTKLPLTSSGKQLYSVELAFNLRNWADTPLSAPLSVSMFNPFYLRVQDLVGIDLTTPKKIKSGYVEGDTIEGSMSLLPLGTSVSRFTAKILVSSGNGLPHTLAINYIPCALVGLPPPPPANPPPPPHTLFLKSSSSSIQSSTTSFSFEQPPPNLQPISIKDGRFYGIDGQLLKLRGINWFGYEDGNTAPDGIWFGPDTLTRDVATIAKRIKALGFNAVRMPFSMKDLWGLRPRMFDWQCEVASAQAFLRSVTDPVVNYPSDFPIDYTLPYDVPSSPGSCGDYLPQNSVFSRFIWQIGFLARNGMYVLIENHLQFDTSVYDDHTAWLQGWQRLMATIALDPVAVNMVMYDILNEPESKGIGWEGVGSGLSMTDNYLAVMDRGYAINPNAIYFIEGTGQLNINSNWGDGFSTDPAVINNRGGSDPTRFFKTLLTKQYRGNVVLSPHIYPPSVTFAKAAIAGPELYNRLTVAHGYLSKQGYCNGNDCQKFMVVPGEFGSKLIDPKDFTFLADLATYWSNPGAVTDPYHGVVENWFWWCWNANSVDTGGMVGEDWLTIQWQKIKYLKSVGLEPWYMDLEQQQNNQNVYTPAPYTPAPTPASTPAPTPAPTAQPTATPTVNKSPPNTPAPTPAPTFARTAAPKQPPLAPLVPASPASVGSLAFYRQCGGRNSPSGLNVKAGNFPWAAYGGPACYKGSICMAQSEWYWQCTPPFDKVAA